MDDMYIYRGGFYDDPHLGGVRLNVRSNAVNISFSFRNGELNICLPPGTPYSRYERAVVEFLPKLLEAKENGIARVKKVYHDFTCDFFAVKYELDDSVDGIEVKYYVGSLLFMINKKVGVNNSMLVRFIRRHIMNMATRKTMYIDNGTQRNRLLDELRDEAVRLNLVDKLKGVDMMSGTKTFGKCSSRGVIKISPVVALLPKRLRVVVYCHELAHLTEMSHSLRFYELLDSYVGGDASKLQREIKNYDWGFLN